MAALLSAGPTFAAGETVSLPAFSLPPGSSVTVEFDVLIDNPLAICANAVSNQATIGNGGSNFAPFLSDDPDVGGAANPTITSLTAVDVGITKSNGASTVVAGNSTTYTLTVTNTGLVPALNATVADTFPAELTAVTWTCVASGGSSCTAAGSGNISDNVGILVGGTLTYTVNATVVASATGTLVNTATVTPAAGSLECNIANNSSTDSDTILRQANLGITKDDGVTSINAGATTTYTIVVSNLGPSDAPGTQVNDTFPAAISSATWSCVASGGSSCTANGSGNILDTINLLAGGMATYTVNATVSGAATGSLVNTATVAAAGGITDPVPGNNSATDTDTINPVLDLSITKDDAQTSDIPGTSIQYTIVVSNAGPATATNATVADTFPASLTGVTWTCVGALGGTCTANGSGNLNQLVTIPAGGSVTFTVNATIAASATGTLSNTATVAAPGGVTDTNAGNNSATDTTNLTPQADLGITKSDSQTTDIPGTSISYTIIATNAGPSDAPTATVADTFPASLFGVTWTCSGSLGGTCPANGSGNLNAAVNLPAGGSVTFSVNATILASATGTLSNTATVTIGGGVTDPAAGNNSATDTTTLTPEADLSITKSDSQTSDVPGTSITYTIMVSNAGFSDVPTATVADTFAASLTGVTWSCVGAGGGTCSANGSGNLNENVALPAGGSVNFTVNATIAPSATGTLSNTATVTAGGGVTDNNVANNSATDTTTLTPQVDLVITKDDGVTSVNAGANTTYTITVTNPPGPSDAVGATVADTFPAAISAVSWTCSATLGSSCPANGSGNINAAVTVAVGGSVTFTATATVSGTATGSLVNTATVTAAGGTTDTNPGNNSATDTDTIIPIADLAITKTDGVTSAVPGGTVTYTIVASNAGPATATGATVADTFAASLTCSTTCVATGGGVCAAGPVAGNLNDSVTLATGETATYTAVCTIANNATGTLSNTATISGGGVTDNNAGNNSATDNDTVLLALDFGDLPTLAQGAPATYPTLLADNGARHGNTGLKLGALIDDETDGQPNLAATGDDTNNTDDEDGVVFTSPLVTCAMATVTVTSSAVAKLDAWVDFNLDGDLLDLGEQIFTNQNLSAGANNLNFAVPCGATITPQTWSRFRLSTAGNLTPSGVAADGEVEDYTVAVSSVADLSITKDDGVSNEVPGTPVTYTIVVSNAGPSNVAGATVTDTFPGTLSGVTWTCTPTGVGASCAANGSGNLNEAVTLPANTSVTFTATGNLSIAATGTLVNTATVTLPAGPTDPNPANNSATDTDTLNPETDLSITKTDGVTSAVPGTAVVYTIVVNNAGPSNAVGATVTDSFPASLTGVTWTCSGAGGGTCPANGSGNLAAVSVNVPVGGSVTFLVNATIASSATGTLVNTATVAAGAGATDPVPGNNSATDSDTLTPQADLAITKSDGVADEVPGTPVTYTIQVTNAGPSDAPGATVSDTFPGIVSGVTWSCVGASGGTCPANGAGNLSAVAVNVPSGGSVTFTATGTIAASATGTLANTATVAAPGGVADGNPANNSATDTDNLVPSADLRITKVDSEDPPSGSALTYTITVFNDGPSDATGVVVTESLPAEVTFGSTTGCTEDPTGVPTCTLGAIAAGANKVYTVAVTINGGPLPGSISNTVNVAATTADPNAANNQAIEVTTLDVTPPTVTLVDSRLGTGDGMLDEFEQANRPIHEFRVTFSEAVQDPVGDGGADDVTNPANYRVLATGPDGDFDTADCAAAVSPNDVAFTIREVTYDSGTRTAAVSLQRPLVNGRYRLHVCGTTSIVDLAGNALDGNGNGTGGDDFVRNFRIWLGNRMANGALDGGMAGWTENPAPPIDWDGASDAQDSPASGSLLVNSAGDLVYTVSQCVDVQAGIEHEVAAAVLMSPTPSTTPITFARDCEFFTGPACAGTGTLISGTAQLQSTVDTWVSFLGTLTSPLDAVSARCTFRVQRPGGASFQAGLDSLFFGAVQEIFSDSFETGDTNTWSACTGCSP